MRGGPVDARQVPSEKRRRWLVLAAILLATLELFVVQEITFRPPDLVLDASWVARTGVRLLLDVSAVAVLFLALSRNVLAFLLLGQMFFFTAAVTYHAYFRRPLSMIDGLTNFIEGFAALPYTASILNGWWVAALLAAMLAKLALVGSAGERAQERGFPASRRKRLVLGAAASWAALVGVGVAASPAEGQGLRAGVVTRFGPALGYLVPAAFEASLPFGDRLLARALEAGRVQPNRLLPVETPLPVRDRVVMIQVESLDWGVLDFRVGGREVTPFLNALRRRSLFYKMEAFHLHGSADADFMAMNGRMPSPDRVTYTIPGYPWEGGLPHFLKPLGYRSSFFHGVTGAYYSRRPAFEAMGFDRLVFAEEMQAEFGRKLRRQSFNGVPDRDVFEVSAQELAKEEGKAFHFLVTVSSHGPFNGLLPDEQELFPEPKGAGELYFNSIRYVDTCLDEYVRRLPPETTVVIYGDHTSQVKFPGYDPGLEGIREYVPLIIHDTGLDLSSRQRAPETLARSGKLTLVDLSNYLRGSLARREPVVSQ